MKGSLDSKQISYRHSGLSRPHFCMFLIVLFLYNKIFKMLWWLFKMQDHVIFIPYSIIF
ncbi:hypothetical protein C0J52_01764 [Blattella germanica]|nr:hypothetical protein C0J52_01764 [Blattella germanica]